MMTAMSYRIEFPKWRDARRVVSALYFVKSSLKTLKAQKLFIYTLELNASCFNCEKGLQNLC